MAAGLEGGDGGLGVADDAVLVPVQSGGRTGQSRLLLQQGDARLQLGYFSRSHVIGVWRRGGGEERLG